LPSGHVPVISYAETAIHLANSAKKYMDSY